MNDTRRYKMHRPIDRTLCVHYARDMHHDAPRMRSGGREKTAAKTRCYNGCYNCSFVHMKIT